MKTTAVVESLSTIQPDVLFQTLPAYFKNSICSSSDIRYTCVTYKIDKNTCYEIKSRVNMNNLSLLNLKTFRHTLKLLYNIMISIYFYAHYLIM